MKIIYCIDAVSNSGGMERILQQKANYFADIIGYEVIIITTEQGDLKPFFQFSPRIRFIDLNVNYGDRADKKEKNVLLKVIWKNLHKPIHKRKLTRVLMKEKANVVITLFNNDIGFLYKIKDGSKKIIEYHFMHDNKIVLAQNKIIKYVQRFRLNIWKRQLSQFDHFVVLTNEDKGLWGNMSNITVIPNFIIYIPQKEADVKKKRIITVGRVSYEKGFDRLLYAWEFVQKEYKDWDLYLFGNGDKHWLYNVVSEKELSNVHIEPATQNIEEEYCHSSIYVLPSRCEGLPMVLLEAMSYGLPIVSFECPCGPKDIIRKEFGTLVPNGDIQGLADAMMSWMADEDKRILGGKAARKAAERYTQDVVMKQWIKLFEE